jgi:hypothetical protein
MPGRGDNNKHGSAGRGSSNQSNQPFAGDGKSEPASNHSRHKTGGSPSIPQEKTVDTDITRDTKASNGSQRTSKSNEKTYNILVDDVPYIIKASPFTFNEETRFYISINGGEDHVFTWDSEVKRLRAIDDSAGELPDAVETAISDKLQGEMR